MGTMFVVSCVLTLVVGAFLLIPVGLSASDMERIANS